MSFIGGFNIFLKDLLVEIFQTLSQTFRINNLEPCTEYWVRVAGVNCGARINSNPERIALREKVNFKFIIQLTETDSCEQWIMQGPIIADIEDEVASQFMLCNIYVPCVANHGLTCSNNHTDAEYRQVKKTD